MKRFIGIFIIFNLILNLSFQAKYLDLKGFDYSTLIETQKSVITDYFSLASASVELVEGISNLGSRVRSTSISIKFAEAAPLDETPAPKKQTSSSNYSVAELDNSIIAVGKTHTSQRVLVAPNNLIEALSITQPFSNAGEMREPRGSPGSYFFLHLLLMFILFFYSRPRGALEANIIIILSILKIQSRFKGLDFLFAAKGSLL